MKSKPRRESSRDTVLRRLALLLSLLFSDAAAFSFCASKGRSRPPSRGMKSLNVAASYDGDDRTIPVLERAEKMKRNTLESAKRNDYSSSIEIIRDLVAMLGVVNDPAKEELGSIVDDAMRSFTNMAFSKPYSDKRVNTRVCRGLEAIELQLAASRNLPSPYANVPRDTLLGALRAVSAVISSQKKSEYEDDMNSPRTETAFRLLQRLLTGNGVRPTGGNNFLSERDFNVVLNAMSNVGRMDIAHRIVALQERARSAPSISIVTYSILLKGYGRQQDIHNVEMTISQAQKNGIIPDTILLNTMIDAYINCGSIDKARTVFRQMLQGTASQHPKPNLRTYNTMLKGFARIGSIKEALALAEGMKSKSLWDDITTNTLVSAAITAREFGLAEELLCVHAVSKSEVIPGRSHPNVEAYTELLDGYAKAGNLGNALGTLQLMRRRNVPPNEYTYSCVIGALARAKKTEQAEKLLEFMRTTGVKPSVVTYNAFISGLTSQQETTESEAPRSMSSWDREETEFDGHVDEAVKVLKTMVKSGVRPNVTTMTIILEAFSKCSKPKVIEAQALVSKFEADKVIPSNQKRVKTAMIRVLGAANDLRSALAEFRTISNPDIVSVNAFLDAACRCGQPEVASSTFEHLFNEPGNHDCLGGPDVITYSILINNNLRQSRIQSVREAQRLYREMRSRGISPDIPLVDSLLASMVGGGRVGLHKRDVQFTLSLLKDAEELPWEPGEFEQRKQAVRAVMIGRVSEIWKENEEYFGMPLQGKTEKEDDLFKKKGWNKVDSGFRLWGGGIEFGEAPPSFFGSDGEKKQEDEFLASKGWNDVDSSFRLF